MPNIKVKRCTVLNLATLLPIKWDGEEHNCVAVVSEICTPRPDLQEVPLQNVDLELFVDGSASRDPRTGQNRVGYAVVAEHDVLAAEPLPVTYSAQKAELTTLIKVMRLAEDKTVNIYTDSRYAFGVVHDFGAIWKHRQFLTSSGKPIWFQTSWFQNCLKPCNFLKRLQSVSVKHTQKKQITYDEAMHRLTKQQKQQIRKCYK